MTWYSWTVVVTIALLWLCSITQIGKPRKPLDAGTVIIAGLINGLFIWAVIALAERAS